MSDKPWKEYPVDAEWPIDGDDPGWHKECPCCGECGRSMRATVIEVSRCNGCPFWREVAGPPGEECTFAPEHYAPYDPANRPDWCPLPMAVVGKGDDEWL